MDKSGVLVGEKPSIEMDVSDGKVRLVWKTSLLKRCLDHEIDRCVGCSLCQICPWDAITLGPIKETASGLIEGAPLVNVDPELCTFCGLCDTTCIFGAFQADYEGEDAVRVYNRISGKHKIDEEKCKPCVLCSKVCPTDALSVDINVTQKEDLVKYSGEEAAEGSIIIDEEKCSYCGLCELLCPNVIKIYWDESAEPPDFKPAVAIRADDEKCDYCGLCANICPDEAITVECTSSTDRKIKEPEITGTLHHDDDLCVKCGLCAIVCPYEALEVEKPFQGKVEIVQLDKCDPTGCNNCFNICPVKAIYPTGTEEKIAILDDHCLYCGACEHSCPYDVLKVSREGYVVKELENAREWEKSRKYVYDALIGKEPPSSGLFERNIVVKPVERVQASTESNIAWNVADGERKKAMKAAQRIRDILKKEKKLHLRFERGKTESLIEKVKEQEGSEST
jgi:4Fe-4S ferredoxin